MANNKIASMDGGVGGGSSTNTTTTTHDPASADKNNTAHGILPNTVVNGSNNSFVTGKQPHLSGNPQVKTPYKSNNVIVRRYLQFTATFFTQNGKQNASYVLGREDVPFTNQETLKGYMNNELIGFTTKNDAQNQSDIPTMTLKLTGIRNWEEVLLPNDYVQLGVLYIGDDVQYGPKTATLMTGMIADVHKSYSDGQYIYVITCQGLAKILANVTLTTFTELSVNNVYLLQDMSQGSGNVKVVDPNSQEATDAKIEAGIVSPNGKNHNPITAVTDQAYKHNLEWGHIKDGQTNKKPEIQVPSGTLTTTMKPAGK